MPELRALDSMHWRLLAMALKENAAIQALQFIQQQQTLSRKHMHCSRCAGEAL